MKLQSVKILNNENISPKIKELIYEFIILQKKIMYSINSKGTQKKYLFIFDKALPKGHGFFE